MEKRVHFIGICGVAMSAIATALWQKGWKVTGSDSGFFPPVSTHLKKLGIPYYSGWHPEKMVEGGAPDLVIVGNAAGSQNPEFLYVQEHNIPFKSFPEIMGEVLVKKNSIVTAGTWGKTTSSALLAHIFRSAGWDPSYMTGGLTQDGAPSAAISGGDWSIVEGDEYKTAKWDGQAKFFHYKPTHLLLTAVSWDHADMYPTERSYFEAFEKLIAMIPETGKIIYCADRKDLSPLVSKSSKLKDLKRIISYGKAEDADYKYGNIKESIDGLDFSITHSGSSWNIKSPMLGDYNAENITGCFAIARECGMEASKIIEGIRTFKGMKRRLEKRYEGAFTIMDDIAHSPEKARSVLSNLRKIYKGKLVAVFEPNSGGRTMQSAPAYDNAFSAADEVIVGKLTKLKIDPANPEKLFDGDTLAEIIGKTHKNVKYIEDDTKLVEYLVKDRKKNDCVVFLGSHGFRGMIEAAVS